MNYSILTEPGFSIGRLKTFCDVADHENFTKAAEANGCTQSNYTKQVRQLESCLGTDLFTREGGTRLTQQGIELRKLCGEFLGAFERFSKTCTDDLQELRFGAGEGFIKWLMMPRLKQVKELGEAKELVFRNMRGGETINQLKNGILDYGVARSSKLDSEIGSIALGKMKYALFARREFGLARKGLKDRERLTKLPLVGMEGGGSYQTALEKVLKSHRIKGVHWAVKCPSSPMMANAVSELKVAAILPEMAEYELSDEGDNAFDCIKIKGLKPLEDLASYSLCWSKRRAGLDPRIKKKAESLSKILHL